MCLNTYMTGELPIIPVRARIFHADGSVDNINPSLTEIEQAAVEQCYGLGQKALERGNPPIGAVLISNDRIKTWGAITLDQSIPNLLRHAEIEAYHEAQADVGRNLTNCTLVTSVAPCSTCTPPFAEGQIGKIIYSAPRWAVRQIAGIMRPRNINMPDLLRDGATETIVVSGVGAKRTLGAFSIWRERHDAGLLSYDHSKHAK